MQRFFINLIWASCALAAIAVACNTYVTARDKQMRGQMRMKFIEMKFSLIAQGHAPDIVNTTLIRLNNDVMDMHLDEVSPRGDGYIPYP